MGFMFRYDVGYMLGRQVCLVHECVGWCCRCVFICLLLDVCSVPHLRTFTFVVLTLTLTLDLTLTLTLTLTL